MDDVLERLFPMPAELRAGYVPSAGGSKQRTHDMDPLVEAVAKECGLAYSEMVLVNAFEDVLQLGLEQLTPLCKEARISAEQIETHADEIGIKEKLTREQVKGLCKFVQFMTLTEKVYIIKFDNKMPGRSVLGYSKISIEVKAEWQALLEATCGPGKFFRAMSTVYETLLKFGFVGQRNGELPADAVDMDKKCRVLKHCSCLVFSEERMRSNLRRYTNSQMKMQPPAKPRDGLDVLLEAARAVGGGV